MQKKLPLKIPPMETYQGAAFILGIILQYKNIKNIFFNSYVNLVCNKTLDSWKVELQFAKVTWDDFRIKGIAEMNLFSLDNLSEDKCANFLKERINQGNYLLLYDIDEFFLSYSSHYHQVHYPHDTYLYGYSAASFRAMAYKDGRLQMFSIPQREIVEGLYGRLKEKKGDVNFCTFRPCQTKYVEMDYKMFVSELVNYLDGTEGDEGQVYGINVYDVIKNCITEVMEGRATHQDFDLRIFRMLWEHKKIMLIHIEDIPRHGDVIEKVINRMIEVEKTAYKMFMLSIKYNMSRNVQILRRISRYVSELAEKEKDVLTLLVHYIIKINIFNIEKN